jgi:hypothetical protein
LIAWADQLGMKEASKLLGETLDEEKKTDQLLTRLAEANINQFRAFLMRVRFSTKIREPVSPLSSDGGRRSFRATC